MIARSEKTISSTSHAARARGFLRCVNPPVGNSLRHSFAKPICFLIISAAFSIVAGCGSSDNSVEQELLRRQRQRAATADQAIPTSDALERARREFDLQNFESVERITEKLLQEDPENADAVFISAQAAKARGDLDEAIARLGRVDDGATDDSAMALRLAGKWLSEAGRYDAAIESLNQLSSHPSVKRRDLHDLAALLNNSGRRMEAADVIQEILMNGDISEKELFSLITLSNPFVDDSRPKPNFAAGIAPAYLAQARVLRDNNLQEALELADRLQQDYPKSAPIHAFAIRLNAEVQNWDRVAKLVLFRPEDAIEQPEFWFAIGTMLQHQGDQRSAVGAFREAISLDPTDRFSLIQMATSLRQIGLDSIAAQLKDRYDLLEESAKIVRAIGKNPGTPEQLNRLAEVLDEVGRPLEAIEWRFVAARQSGGLESDIQRLKQSRRELIESGIPDAAVGILGDVSAEDWPAPNLDQIRVSGNLDQAKAGAPSPIRLVDIAEQVGLDFQFRNRPEEESGPPFIHQVNGGGIGVLDFDLDGWQDCYFSQAGGQPMAANDSQPNALFRNLQGTRFEPCTIESQTGDRGFGQGVSAADLNQDGFPDLLVANIGQSLWYRNQGDGTFVVEMLADSNSVERSDGVWTTSIGCGDLTGNGRPDIVMVNYVDDSSAYEILCSRETGYCIPQRFRAARDKILATRTDGSLESLSVGMPGNQDTGHGFGIVIGNIDRKPGNEAFIVNDTDSNHYLTFAKSTNGDSKDQSIRASDSAHLVGLANGVLGSRRGCMGVAQGDFDRNGQLDFHVTNFWDEPSDLYLQRSGAIFVNETMGRGTGSNSTNRVGWGSQATDFDRDGWLDLAVLNGHVLDLNDPSIPYEMSPQLFRGEPDRFVPVPVEDDSYWNQPALGRTLAKLDWNRDGKVDLVANHLDRPATLLQNESDSLNWIRCELVGVGSERRAVGAIVSIESGGQSWTGWVVGGDGFQCNNEAVVDFGIGDLDADVTVTVEWPSGLRQQLGPVPANRQYLLVEGQSAPFPR